MSSQTKLTEVPTETGAVKRQQISRLNDMIDEAMRCHPDPEAESRRFGQITRALKDLFYCVETLDKQLGVIVDPEGQARKVLPLTSRESETLALKALRMERQKIEDGGEYDD